MSAASCFGARVALAALLVLAAGACGSAAPPVARVSPSAAPAASPSAQQPSPSPVPPSPAACRPLAGGTQYLGGSPRPAITDVRVGMQNGADRLVVEFTTPGVPPYRLEPNPTTPPGGTEFNNSPSGQMVKVQGTYGVLLTIQDLDWTRDMYAHGRDLPAGYSMLKEVRVTSDFEAIVTIGIGLARNACPTVTLLSAPPRLVVDFPTG